MPRFVMMRCLSCGNNVRSDEAAKHECPVPPERRCSWCGVLESESQWGILIPVEVITNSGEEGAADVVQLLCDEHAERVHHGLTELGFRDHRHGGANFLEDEECPGYKNMDNCPTPTSYGQVIVPGPGGTWTSEEE